MVYFMSSNPLTEGSILKEIAELLNEGTEITQTLHEVLEKLLQVTGFQIGWIFLIDENGDQKNPKLTASHALPPALSANNCYRMKKKSCWCVNRYRKGELTKASNIIECQRIESALRENDPKNDGLTHHATVPLQAGNERFGILNVGSPNKTHFHKQELALLESIAYQIGTALKRIYLTQKEQDIALHTERTRLARDLHDSVNQLLFSLSLTARAGQEMTAQPEVKDTFQYIQDLSQEALSEMRTFIKQLRPPALENGLISSFINYAKVLDLHIHTKMSGIEPIDPQVEEALWRIGQEAMANCKKHSGQQDIFIEMNTEGSNIILSISDNGTGFFYDKDFEMPTMGLRSMQSRAEEIGGKFQLTSKVGMGTFIQISIPLLKEENQT